MRHKTFLFNPALALTKGIKVYKCLQNPGEFVITLAKSYHAGFNMGFNCAEAVNFANKSWINLGMKAKSCDCQSGSVKVDMNYFLRNLINKKKIAKRETKNLDKELKLSSRDKKEFMLDKKSKLKNVNHNEEAYKNNENLLKRKRKKETSKILEKKNLKRKKV